MAAAISAEASQEEKGEFYFNFAKPLSRKFPSQQWPERRAGGYLSHGRAALRRFPSQTTSTTGQYCDTSNGIRCAPAWCYVKPKKWDLMFERIGASHRLFQGIGGSLSEGPLEKSRGWTNHVNGVESEAELTALRQAVARGAPPTEGRSGGFELPRRSAWNPFPSEPIDRQNRRNFPGKGGSYQAPFLAAVCHAAASWQAQ
ncbi:hypothetical protein Pla144_00040 [Bythopirellula polymerisocia]|uniref:Uncharacterized protein n=2 Tax=Bythopirellula polymerisocia TaxID=2528003 RepID=A0A5C6CXQ6_9BACT|nr:hypothetical protein Pla144_00040 [Bythopirellula polymerisocia]